MADHHGGDLPPNPLIARPGPGVPKAQIRHARCVIIRLMASPSGRLRRIVHSRLIGTAYVVAHLGAVCIGLWVVGDVSNEPYDSPDGGSMLGLRLPADLYGDGPGTVVAGVIGVALVTLSIVLARTPARVLPRARTAWLWLSLAWSGLIGFAVGAALRGVFAITYDANIGGGLLLMFGLPVLTFAWVAGLVPLRYAEQGGTKQTDRPGPATSTSTRTQASSIVLWAIAGALVIAAPFNVLTLADGLYWTFCRDPQCGDAASVGQIVYGGLGIVSAVVTVTGAALWHRRGRRSRLALADGDAGR